MKIALLILSQLLPFLALSQSFDANAKTQGYIKTTEGKFEGTVDVNPQLDQALWSQDNQTKIFGAGQIKELKVVDTSTNLQRTFYGFEMAGDHYLFEALTTGKIKILYKEGIKKSHYDDSIYPSYFVLGRRKELISLEREKDFLEAFEGDSKWMKQFIKNHNLNMEKKKDIQTAFNYYNNQFEAVNP